MTKKVMTSVKIPASLEKKLLEQVISDGYKMHGKSKWIVEAIDNFLQIPHYLEFVEIADDMENLNSPVSIRLPEPTMDKLDKALIEVRRVYPEMEGVKSRIIRASIVQRLLRGKSQ